MHRIIPVALIMTFASGCFVSKYVEDSPWTREQVDGIEVGKTTKAELLEKLGPPTEIVRLLDSEAFVYRHTVAKDTGAYFVAVATFRSDTQHDAITVIVDRKGIVRGVGSRFKASTAAYGLPGHD